MAEICFEFVMDGAGDRLCLRGMIIIWYLWRGKGCWGRCEMEMERSCVWVVEGMSVCVPER